MDSDEERGGTTYAQMEQYFNEMALEGPSMQEWIDAIFSLIISFLPRPCVGG
jgi:hypothetical protein